MKRWKLAVGKIFKALDNMRQKKKAGQTCKKSMRPKVSLLFNGSKILKLASSDHIIKGLIHYNSQLDDGLKYASGSKTFFGEENG